MHSEFLTSGPDHLKPVETIFVKKIADEAKKEPSKSQISGIVSHADMTLGEGINEVLVTFSIWRIFIQGYSSCWWLGSA